jgi:type IV pilus assembly protein PilP
MRKNSRINIYRITGMISFGFVILFLVTPGCKKKEVAPPPAAVKVTPLPNRAVQANSSAAKQTSNMSKGAPTIAGSAQPGQPKPPAVSAVQGSAPAPAAGPVSVQKQMSSQRLVPGSKGVNLDFTSRRDPFKPYMEAPAAKEKSVGKGAAKPEKDALPIQRFDVEKFRISGIITGVKENSALVLDPNGKGYVVKAGMLLGTNNGRIKRITDASLEVEENFKDDSGKVKKRLVKLMLIRKK